MELDGAAKRSVTSLRCLGWEELSVWYRAVRFLCHRLRLRLLFSRSAAISLGPIPLLCET